MNIRRPGIHAWILTVVLSLGVGACGEPLKNECASSTDCGDDSLCVAGVCKPNAEAPECKQDADCSNGEGCKAGVCTATDKPQCTKAEDCGPSSTCNNGACEPNSSCLSDDQCDEGEACENGACEPIPPCKSNGECDSGEFCDNGACEPIPPCHNDGECDFGNHCDDGACKPGACREADKNACGGCAALVETIGTPCGPCLKDQLACDVGGESLACNGNTSCSAPTVTTSGVTAIGQYAATLHGTVENLGDGAFQEHGFCVGRQASPSLNSDARCVNLGTLAAPAAFTTTIDELELETNYYVRAYALNETSASYGQQESFRTASAVLPVVTTVAVSSPEPGLASIDALLSVVGIPWHHAHGVCIGTAENPALEDRVSSCTDLGIADDVGPFTVDFDGLTPGTTYHVRAFAQSSKGVAYGANLSLSMAPAAPVIATVTNGTNASKVVLTWDAVEGATGYKVYRDGEELTRDPIPELTFDDTTATAGGVPTGSLSPVASGNLSDKVQLTWTAATSPRGQTYNYTLTAINAGGESEHSISQTGARAAQPVTGYEVSISGGDWLSAGLNLSYADTTAPAGAVSQANPAASQGTSSTAVNLSLSGAEASAGTAVNYRVRAKNAAGYGEQSPVAQGHRGPATLTYQWERSVGASDASYTVITGATARSYSDTTAPSDGTQRFYRVVVRGGPSTITSAGVSGFRGVALPELETLAATGMTQTQATLKGKVTGLGGTSIVEHGYCYSTSSEPVFVPSGSNPSCKLLGTRSTTGNMADWTAPGLIAGTRYYARVFAQTTKSGAAFVSYGPAVEFITVPATPAAPTATTNIIEHVKLTWTRGINVTKYDVYRGATKIATLDASTSSMTYTDIAAPASAVPVAVPSLTQGTRRCAGTDVNWTKPAAPTAGAAQTYSLVAINGSGSSPGSPNATGQRASAPVLGYKIRNTSVGGSAISTVDASTTQMEILNLSKPTVNGGTVSATKGVETHSTYVVLKSTGSGLGASPSNTIEVRAYNASGDGAAKTVSVSRSDSCALKIIWQKRYVPYPFIRYDNIVGATAFTYNHTGAAANGKSDEYRAYLYVDGTDIEGNSTNSDIGYRYARVPTIVTGDQNTASSTTTSIVATAQLTDFGVPSVQDHNQIGLCLSTSMDPAPGNPGSQCYHAGEYPTCTWSPNGTPKYVITCTFSGLTRNTSYAVRGYVTNEVTFPGYQFGDVKVYKTKP